MHLHKYYWTDLNVSWLKNDLSGFNGYVFYQVGHCKKCNKVKISRSKIV